MQVWNKRWMHAAAVAVGLTCGASAARAQGALVTGGTVLAHIGDVVNGLSPTTFGGTLGFSIPMLDENGQVVFSSSMVGGTATNGANDKAILRGTTRANLAVVIRGEDPAPGLPGIVLSDAAGTSSMSSLMRLSADGRVLFATSLRDPVNPLATTVDSARMGGVIGSFAPLVREGDAAPGTVGATLTQDLSSLSQQNSGLNRSGRVLVLGSLANGDTTSAAPPAIANDQGWWSGIPGSLELVQRKGDTPAGAPGTNILSFGTVSQMNISGQVVFNSTLSTVLGSPPATAANNNILSIYTPGPSTAKIVREGDAAPGTVGATFNNAADTWASDIGLNAFNNSGQVGAWWELLGGDVVGTTNNAALYRASSSGMTMIMRKGDVAPGTGGARFSAVTTSSVLMNSAGRFAVLGTLVQDAITPVPPVTATNDTGVWVGNEFGLTLVMREGDTAPLVAGGGTITGFTVPFLFNDLGQVLFRATFTGGTATNALYSWDPLLGLTLQMANTDMIEVQPGVFKAPIAWGTTQHNNGDSASLSFNHAGKFVLRMNHIVGTTIISGQVQSGSPTTAFCLGDGTGAACPCANTGATGRGCASMAFPAGAILSSIGIAGASVGTDTLLLKATDIPGPGLFFQSTGLAGTPIPFGDGHLCAAVGIIRLGVVFPTGNVASYPGGLTPNPIHIAGGTMNGDTRHYQCWYRSVPGLCNPQNFNLTQGLTLTWGP